MPDHGGKREGSGRPKGSTDRNSVKAIERLAKAGVDPLQKLMDILAEAEALYAKLDPELLIQDDLAFRAGVAKELLQYQFPKLRAMDHKLDEDQLESLEASLARLDAQC